MTATASTAHLSDADVEEIGRHLDAVRDAVMADLGRDDSAYIHRVIAVQRGLEVAGRVLLQAGVLPPAWLAGTAALSLSKILSNMEIGHNVMHGQWDWMNDPEIHSSTWEWDSASPAEDWKHSHNYMHHTFTNIVGKDRDVGYGVLRMSEDQRWHPFFLAQPVVNIGLALFFQWGVALHDLEVERAVAGKKPWQEVVRQLRGMLGKFEAQVLKDYVVFPALAGPAAPVVAAGNLTANLVRNLWAYTVIFCGHFPEGVETFSEDRLEGESKGEWYLRQLLGSANIEGGPLFHVMTGNLSHQIEHHLFPDLPSNRYQQVAPYVQALCDEHELPYVTGSLSQQYGTVFQRILRLSLPNELPRVLPRRLTDAVPSRLTALIPSTPVRLPRIPWTRVRPTTPPPAPLPGLARDEESVLLAA